VNARASEVVPLSLGALHAGHNTFANKVTFELGNRPQHMEEKPPGGRGGINALVEDHQLHAQGVEFVGQCDKMPDAAGKTVEFHASDNVNLPFADRGNERVEGGSMFGGTRVANVHELFHLPSSSRSKAPERD
jgi:hypothetical protein